MALTLIAIQPDGTIDSAVGLSEHAAPVITGTLDNYKARGSFAPWLCYLTFDDGTNVGTCGFVAPPDGDVVEIAYYTFPEHEGHGYARQAAKALVGIAQGAKPDVVITAHTLPQDGPSCQVLRNCGFTHTGSVEHPQDGPIWVWTLNGS
ncbi:MAG: GNAT family N-acetyltransferase [Hyphomicrobium sp.]|jgi:ribosomal-protein-alanine N-acetyltransferase|uniref:GNAT family N-acetyltransferase n=1 Tax=Hyphomicrobium sp. TaxID=82 RepID=UPI0025C1A2CE|nr:GNAT family N-acetyltransferase [Hyphomicrobium sp.]MBX9862482.1 GNAT family N-acetyltransferase [Hyphomicrobium sp.]